MLQNHKTLTFAVPTYNGHNSICDTLDSILDSVTDSNRSQVEILVIDNASQDNTRELVQNYQKNYQGIIRIVTNDENIGYDKNIDKLFLESEGLYVKIIADDDLLKPDSVDIFLNYIKNYPETHLFLFNFDLYDVEMKECTSSLTMNSNNDVECRTGEDFLQKSYGRYGQVSSLMIKRQAWLDVYRNFEVGKNYIHVFTVFNLIQDRPSLIISNAYIKVRDGSPNFESSVESFFLVPLHAIDIYLFFIKKGLSVKEYKTLLKSQRYYCIKKLIQAKLFTIKDKSLFMRESHKNMRFSGAYLMLIYLILFLPKFVFFPFKQTH